MTEDHVSWLGWWFIGVTALMIGAGAFIGLNWDLIAPRVSHVLERHK